MPAQTFAKCLLYAINGGKDEKYMTKDGKPMQVGPEYAPITSEYLDYDEVMHKYDLMMDWLAGIYVNILNLIQYMHDKYYYEAAEMAPHRHRRAPHLRDRYRRFLPCGGFPLRDQIRKGQRLSATKRHGVQLHHRG